MEIQKFENMSCLRCISVVSGLLQLWAVPDLLWAALGCSGLSWVSSGLFLPRFGLLLDLLVAFLRTSFLPGFPWGILKQSWRHLGPSGVHFGVILGPYKRILGQSWDRFGGHLGPYGTFLGSSWPRPSKLFQNPPEKFG
jgi:hypothetical protein